jgi:SNF2 family DNA or RNA helicase
MLLQGHGLVRVDGSIDALARRAAVQAFQTDPTTRIFLANPAAAGAGLTLHAARHAIYESLSNQAAHYLQSLDRIHRRGQTRPVTYHTLLSEDSVEIPEYERLIAKAKNQADLLGDRDPRPDRQGLITELRSMSG